MRLEPTDGLPLNQLVFATVISGVPVESTPMLIKSIMSPLGKTIEAHNKHRKRRKTSIREIHLASTRIVSTAPGHDTVANLGYQRLEIFGTEFKGSDRKAQIFERKGTKLAVKQLRDSQSLRVRHPSDQNLALRKVNFKA